MPQLSRRAMLSCLCLCLLSGTISCANDAVSVETTQTSTESTETTENEETLFVSDDLPDDLDGCPTRCTIQLPTSANG